MSRQKAQQTEVKIEAVYPTCGACVRWVRDDADVGDDQNWGECFRHPPTVMFEQENSAVFMARPATNFTERPCGEFKPAN